MRPVRRSIIKKTLEFSVPTLVSRMLGLAREIVQARFLGVGLEAQAFIAAFKIPGSLRKIFAEGALTGAFVPTVVSILKTDGKKSINDLMTLSFIVFEGVLFFICVIIFMYPAHVIKLIAWGFSTQQIMLAVPYLRILISFILFISSSALLGGVLQAVHHFFVPAFFPVVLNVFYLAGLFVCKWYALPLTYLSFSIVLGSVVVFFMHLYMYFRYHFSFGVVTQTTRRNFRKLMTKFIPSMLGMSVLEINLFIDSTLASFFGAGYVLLYYGYRFMGIPLGVFGVAFSSILLPHFSRVVMYAPKRMGFYLLESAKLVFWVTVPAALLLGIFSRQIYTTLLVTGNSKFSAMHVPEASLILIAFLFGLFFFALNKILLNIYYSFHDMRIPTVTSVVATFFNIIANLVLMHYFRAVGIAMATSLSGVLQSTMLIYYLRKKYDLDLYLAYFVQFAWRFLVQLMCVMSVVYAGHRAMFAFIASYVRRTDFLLYGIGFWLWTIPFMVLTFVLLYVTRSWFKLRLHFLDNAF
jgi:putative peptidoglycan lipid II flippase